MSVAVPPTVHPLVHPVLRELRPRGPLSAAVLARLRDDVPLTEGLAPAEGDALADADLQLALFCLYGLAYGWTGRDDLEWDADLLALRARLESAHERALRELVGELPAPAPEEVAATLFAMTAPSGPPRVAAHLKRKATPEQLAEYLRIRSLYHVREADPHSWAIPRLTGPAKAALVEIQGDEYGNGGYAAMHSSLFARAMTGLGLDPSYGAYLPDAPTAALAWHSTMSLFGLHARHLGAIVGHLAAYEMTSSVPNALVRDAFARAGHGPEVTDFFAEHVLADAVHEQVAAHDLAGALARQEPHRVPAIVFGAAASLAMDDVLGDHLLDAWGAGRSALWTDQPR